MKKVERVKFRFDERRSFGFEILTFKEFLRPSVLERVRRRSRVEFYNMIFATGGQGVHEIDFVEYPYQAGDMVMTSRNRVHSFLNTGASGYVLMFTEDFLYRFMGGDAKDVIEIFKRTYMNPVARWESQENSVQRIQLELMRRLYLEDSSKKEMLMASMMRTLSILIYEKCMEPEERDVKEARFLEFVDLVDSNIDRIKTVEGYAKMMYLSKKTINAMTRKAVDMSAKQFIIERLILEIKRNLCSPEKTVNEIADDLGFSEPSNLTKFFRTHVGITPKEFRRENNQVYI